jgi:hypothetical protein
MTTQQKGLLEALNAFGWELAKTEEILEWWADNVWVMRSAWSPQNCEFYLTFLVDPQSDRNANKAEKVWAVKASSTPPTQWQQCDGEITFVLGHGWAKRLDAFIAEASNFRTRTAK